MTKLVVPGHAGTERNTLRQLGELRAVAAAARGIEFGHWLQAPLPQLVEELVPEVDSLLTRTLATITDIATVLGDGNSPSDQAGINEDIWLRPAAYHAVNVALVARIEVVEKQRMLGRVGLTSDRWEVLSRCDRGAHKVWKIAAALELGLAEAIGVEPQLRYVSDLELALEIRRVYATFRRGILRDHEPTAETIEARLVGAAATIARLVGRDVCSRMRISDRAELERLRQRLAAWFHEPTGRCSLAGLRLWRDIAGFAVLLRQVNQRTELIEHDLTTGKALLSRLAESEPRAPPPPELRSHLERLLGACDDLDRRLRDPASSAVDLAELIAALTRSRAIGTNRDPRPQPFASASKHELPTERSTQ